jgi:hypothetical protein
LGLLGNQLKDMLRERAGQSRFSLFSGISGFVVMLNYVAAAAILGAGRTRQLGARRQMIATCMMKSATVAACLIF